MKRKRKKKQRKRAMKRKRKMKKIRMRDRKVRREIVLMMEKNSSWRRGTRPTGKVGTDSDLATPASGGSSSICPQQFYFNTPRFVENSYDTYVDVSSMEKSDSWKNLDLRYWNLALQRAEFDSIGRKGDGIVVGAINKGGTGPMAGKKQEIETLLVTNKIDILGIFESEIHKGDKVKNLEIKGYKLTWDRGYLCKERKTARVAIYIKDNIEF